MNQNQSNPVGSAWIARPLYWVGRFLIFSASLLILGLGTLWYYELMIGLEAEYGQFEDLPLWFGTAVYLLTVYIIHVCALLILLLAFYPERTRQAGLTTHRGHWILKRLFFFPITLLSFMLLVEAGGLIYHPYLYWYGPDFLVSNPVESIFIRTFAVAVLVFGFIWTFSD